MTARKWYTARYTLEDGYWLVEIDEIPQVHSFARTLESAQSNIRDALGLWLHAPDPGSIQIHDEITGLPPDVSQAIVEADRSRKRAAELSARAQELTAHAAETLVGTLGLSIRDAGRILKISHQRVHQIVQTDTGSARDRRPARQ
ncbi:MAG TPA: type II toxin-antitoxin system HicB family antitoxin [Chloroflexota bacterium]|nr:type II toxin-antitoxin system HicB family antitoxin [Chloroflexota bacterium]